jgi:hypothetical protein
MMWGGAFTGMKKGLCASSQLLKILSEKMVVIHLGLL